jgi:hypothetical protein
LKGFFLKLVVEVMSDCLFLIRRNNMKTVDNRTNFEARLMKEFIVFLVDLESCDSFIVEIRPAEEQMD